MNPELDPHMQRLLNETINNISFVEDEGWQAMEAIQKVRGVQVTDAQLGCTNESTTESSLPMTIQSTHTTNSIASKNTWIITKG